MHALQLLTPTRTCLPAAPLPGSLCFVIAVCRADNALSGFNCLASHLMRTRGQLRSGRLSSQSSQAQERARCS